MSVVVVLVVASGAGWESRVLALLTERPGIVVLKRCVDVDDLLAAASSGQAEVAVVGVDAHGLDTAAVDHLRAHGVRPVAIVPGGPALDAACLRATRVGIRAMVSEDELDALPATVLAGEEPGDTVVRVSDVAPAASGAPVPGRVVTVWGPAGAPGRTTLAVNVAAELARRQRPAVLVDADPQGGAVAQQLGILDEVSGLLSAARVSTSGMLEEKVGSVQRALGRHLSVVTGLPRADRWVEVRSGVIEHLAEVCAARGDVVLDTGPSLEHDPSTELSGRPGRHQMTRAAVEVADEVLVVGSADPVGLSRLARGLVELRDLTGGAPVHVVVNRMRPTLGWKETDVAGMVEGFARVKSLHFLPDDQPAADRALVAGRSVVEAGESLLAAAVSSVVDAVVPESVVEPVRRRTAGRGRRP